MKKATAILATVTVSVMCLAMTASVVQAGVIASESFDYGSSAIANVDDATLAGGVGWDAADQWRNTGDYDSNAGAYKMPAAYSAGGLSYSDPGGHSIAGAGGAIVIEGDGVSDANGRAVSAATRTLATNLSDIGVDGTRTIWTRKLIQAPSTASGDVSGGITDGNAGLFSQTLATGLSGSKFKLRPFAWTSGSQSLSGLTTDTPWLILTKVVMSDTVGSDGQMDKGSAYLWAYQSGVDALPTAEPLADDAAKYEDLDIDHDVFDDYGFFSRSSRAVLFDEVVIGTELADVLPSVVPEPATVGLLGLGGLAILRRRRK